MNNPFTERYRTYSDLQLLEIIENGKDYQPIALETAKAELESRKLSEAELAEAKQILKEKQQDATQKEESSKVLQSKVREIGTKVAHQLNPTTHKSHELIIKIICFYLGFELLWSLYDQFSLLTFILFEPQPVWDPTSILFFIPYIYVPLIIFFFWKRTKTGWTLYVLMLSFVISFGLISLIESFTRDEALDEFFPGRSMGSYIMPLFISGAQLVYINTPPLKEIFLISLKRQLVCIAAPVLMGLIMWQFLS